MATTYNLREVIKTAMACVAVHGFTSIPKAAASGAMSTCDRVKNQFGKIPDASIDTSTIPDSKVNDVIDFFKNHTGSPKSAFVEVVQKICKKQGPIPETSLPYVVASPHVYSRVLEERQKDAAAEAINTTIDYIGTIGASGEFFVKLIEHRWIASLKCTLYTVHDRSGNIGVFFDKKTAEELGIHLNECFLMKAFVKRQEVSRYTKKKETVFNRVKIVQNVGKKS